MSIRVIPLEPIPNQRLSFRINESNFDIEINLRRGNLYISAWRDNVNQVHNRVLRSYAPMGDGFMLVDTEGTQDPTYEQLGTRFLLMKEDG